MSTGDYLPYISDSEVDTFSTSEDTDYGWSSDDESAVSSPGPTDDINIVPTTAPISSSLPFQASLNTSLVVLTSRDRDRRVYPDPTFFTLRLPRTYRNVRSINITELNLLNSFFNFTNARGNTYLHIRELGRTIRDASGNLIPNDIRVEIRTGTYSSTALVTELNNALNQTPLFADISGGLGAFINVFQGTGDFSLLFNQPGPVVFNSITREYEANVTMNQLVSRYFQNIQTVGTVSFTYNQCLVAYYYPIIKEMTARGLQFNAYPETLPVGFIEPTDYILFAFQGLDDAYILGLLQDSENLEIFDEYRSNNTFVTALANRYVCTYNTSQGRFTMTAPGLNISIQTDLTNQYNQFLTEEVVKAGYSTVASFQSLYAALSLENGALLEFYNYIHTRYTNNFGIDFGKYTAEFFADPANEITLYNTTDRLGWATSLLPEVSSNAISRFPVPAPQVSTPLSNLVIYPTDTGAENFVSSYNLSTITFLNASETTYGYTDVPFQVLPTCYQRINFTSRCRQTISAMTIPRYLSARGPGTEETYPFGSTIGQTPLLFTGASGTPFSTLFIRTDISGVPDFDLYNVEQVDFTSRDYMRSLNTWISYIKPQILAGTRVQQNDPNFGVSPPVGDIVMFSYRPHLFFQMQTSGYPAEPNAKFRVDIVVETQDGSRFPVPIVVARYRDRAAFMIDALSDLNQEYQEDPRHVFERGVFGTGISSAVLTIDVLNNQTNYFMVHVQDSTVLPSAIPLRVFALLTDDYGVYTIASELDRRDMPYNDLPLIADQFTPNSAIFDFPLTSIYDSTKMQIGYDISGVSNNLLDYYIQSSDNTFFDPTSMETHQTDSLDGVRFQFDYISGGSPQPAPTVTNWSLYFAPTSKNQIRDLYGSGTANIYLNSSIALKAPANGNEALLVNWWRSGDLRHVEEFLLPTPTGADIIQTRVALSTPGIFLACTNTPSQPTDASTSVAFQDVSGFCGLSFMLNPNDIVKLNTLQLKFAYISPSQTAAGFPFSRSASPLGLTNSAGARFFNQATPTRVTTGSASAWDDWYIANRRNIRVGVFRTADVAGADVGTLSIAGALATFTLRKVTQVSQFTNSGGTLRSREPDWGTYYTYEPVGTPGDTLWTPNSTGTAWTSTIVGADTVPTYRAGEASYPGYFLTHTNINNYNFLPRSYGIAPSVGYAMETPYALPSTYTSDIPNSYTIVPFYWDEGSSVWHTGSFWAASFTRQPGLPDPAVAGGGSHYYGPAGPFGWTVSTATSTIVLANGAETVPKPYYWNAKIAFETLNMDYNPATDLSLFGGFTGVKNEYQDTVLFFYSNTTIDSDLADITGVDELSNPVYKWGIEQNTNYQTWDDQNGYNFLSYVHDVTVRSTTASTVDYSFHVRGYVPTSQFTTGLRLIGKNFTDFGTASLAEVGAEITNLAGYQVISDTSGYAFLTSTAQYSTIINTNDAIRLGGGNFFSHQYADALMRFDSQFYASSITFGKRIGYSGRNFTLAGYRNTQNQYVSYYSSLRGVQLGFTNVLSTATGRLNEYIQDQYANILPPSFLSRNRYTDPLPFSMLFSTYTVEPFRAQVDEWGLGWNLGFPKEDTPSLTAHVASTFIRIFDDYIYLQVNPEYDINMMGVSAREDLSLTRDTFAEDRKYYAKILLNNFGGFCRAAVYMPKEFSPTLGKYDTISMQLVDRNGAAIVNTDCDYSITLQITELVDGAVNGFATVPLRAY